MDDDPFKNSFGAVDDAALAALFGDDLRGADDHHIVDGRDRRVGEWRASIAQVREAILETLTGRHLLLLLAQKAPDVVLMTRAQYEADIDQAAGTGVSAAVCLLSVRRDVDLATGEAAALERVVYVGTNREEVEALVRSGALAALVPEDGYLALTRVTTDQSPQDGDHLASEVAYYDADGDGPFDLPPPRLAAPGLRR